MLPYRELVLAGLLVMQAGQTPPIFQPGAPGTAARVISAERAVDLGRTSFTEDDVRFMQHMVVHHAQAVEMVDLLRTRGADTAVRRLGERIAQSQEAEIALMRGWLSDRGQPETAADLHAGHAGHAGHAMPGMAPSDTPVMPGMLSPVQMQALASAEGAAFDRLFLQGMIQHHQGALDMVDDLLARPDAAEDPLLSDFTTSVVADQSAEILRMQSALSDL
ncbi:MAG TPA: DUF305 domain-containing protein [Brevundimonas sp.]|nr:DUF305 domain-containing protein [Brevundimonas sp.]